MAENAHLTFIVAGDATPASIRLRDLLALLADLEAAISATARHISRDAAETELSLLSVTSGGSAVYDLSVSPQAQKAAERISSALNSRNSELLPQSAIENLNSIQRRAIKIGRAFVLNNDQFRSRIEPSIPLFSDALVSGSTSLFGYLNAVGGTYPTAKIRLGDGRQLTAEVATQSLAQELAKCLYHYVALEGDAWWHASTMDIRRFRIRQLGAYDDRTTPAQAFTELASVSPGIWDEVDPEKYINDLDFAK